MEKAEWDNSQRATSVALSASGAEWLEEPASRFNAALSALTQFRRMLAEMVAKVSHLSDYKEKIALDNKSVTRLINEFFERQDVIRESALHRRRAPQRLVSMPEVQYANHRA